MIRNNLVRFPLTTLLIVLSMAVALLVGMFVAFASTTQLPILGAKSGTFALVAVPAVTLLVVALARGDLGLGFLLGTATFLISQTGMQLDVGNVRTSALEVLIVAATLLLLFHTVVVGTPPRWPRTVMDAPLLFFAFLGFPALLLALSGHAPYANIITELKGYFLYPLLAYVIVAWVRTPRRWLLVAVLGVVCALAVAASGLVVWRQGNFVQVNTTTFLVARVAGTFGTINQYAFYLSGMGLLALGLMLYTRKLVWQALCLGCAVVLFVGMSVAGSRGAFVGTAVGLLLFVVLQRRYFKLWLPVLFLFGALVVWQLQNIRERTAAESGSDLARLSFLETGIEIFKNYPVFGAGWGVTFWLGSNNLLQPTDGIPWLHNEYLNLLTQVGLVGLAPFVWLWWRVFRAGLGLGWKPHLLKFDALTAGALAGVVAILVEAGTDHVFWRPDIAGQVWWLAGMLLALVAMSAGKHDTLGDH